MYRKPRTLLKCFSQVAFVVGATVLLQISQAQLVQAGDTSQCKAPSESASQWCMGSSGPITVSEEEEIICIPGCTYTVSEVNSATRISASYDADRCSQYAAYVTSQGDTGACHPGQGAQDVVRTLAHQAINPGASALDAQQKQPLSGGSQDALQNTLQNCLDSMPDAQKIECTRDDPSWQSPGNTNVGDSVHHQCADGLWYLNGTSCPEDNMRSSFGPTAAGEVPGGNGSADMSQSGASLPNLPDVQGPYAAPVPRSITTTANNPGTISAPLPGNAEAPNNNEAPLSPQYVPTTPAPAVSAGRSPPSEQQPTNWVNTMWQGFLHLFGIQPKTSLQRNINVAAAASAQSAAGQSATCYGGEVFVYSKDFSDIPLNASNPPAEARQFQCYRPSYSQIQNQQLQWTANANPGSPLNFKEHQILAPTDACKLLPATNASGCAVTYYGVVPDLSKSLADVENPNMIPSKLQSGLCNPAFTPRGQSIQFSYCVAVEQQMRARALNAASAQAGKPYPSIDLNTVKVPSLLDTYAKWGNIAPRMGGGPLPTGLTLPSRYFGVGASWKF